jgi:hypothetical protein
MAKKQILDFTSVDASTIADCIMNKVISVQALHSFRNRCPGGARTADRLYPQTREALLILKNLKQQARGAKTIREILSPYSAELAKGRDVLDIIKPVITAWKNFYFSKGTGLTDEQVLLLIAVQSAGEFQELTGEAVPSMTTD